MPINDHLYHLQLSALNQQFFAQMSETVLIFGTRWSSIGRPESSKPGRVHLFLQKVARVRIVDVRVVLELLNQIWRIVWAATVGVERAAGSRFVLHRAAVDHVVDVLDVADPWDSSAWRPTGSTTLSNLLWVRSGLPRVSMHILGCAIRKTVLKILIHSVIFFLQILVAWFKGIQNMHF